MSQPVSVGELDHPRLDELRRVADASPQYQRRILSIENPMVHRLRISNERGATWLEEAQSICWLCAAHRREDGSDDDHSWWFAGLHAQGILLPDPDDEFRRRAEAAIRLRRELTSARCALADEGLREPGVELVGPLRGWLPCRRLVRQSDGMQEIWCALSIRVVDGKVVSDSVICRSRSWSSVFRPSCVRHGMTGRKATCPRPGLSALACVRCAETTESCGRPPTRRAASVGTSGRCGAMAVLPPSSTERA